MGAGAVWGRALAFFGGAGAPSGSFSNFPEVSRDGREVGWGNAIYRSGERGRGGEWNPFAALVRHCDCGPRASPARPGEGQGRGRPGGAAGALGVLKKTRGESGPREGLGATPEPANWSPWHFGDSWRVRHGEPGSGW